MIILIISAIILLGIVFYPIRESPLSGGSPQENKKVSLYKYYELEKGISSSHIVEHKHREE